MREQAADDEIDWLPDAIGQDIADLVVDRIGGIGRFARNRIRLAREIEPDEINRQLPLARPAPDRAQQIAITAADIYQRRGPIVRRMRDGAAQLGQNRPMPEHVAVEARRSYRKALSSVESIPAPSSHSACLLRQVSDVALRVTRIVTDHPAVRNNIVSAVSPGPNDIAQPLRPRPAARSKFSITNITVADDILP